MPEASRLEEELKSKFSYINIELIQGSSGIFEVYLNDRMIFDKKNLKKFPKNNEISTIIYKLD